MLDRDIAEEVFKPGNLVFGCSPYRAEYPGLFEKGIKTASALNISTFSADPYSVCTAILTKRKLPERYTEAQHYGPKNDRPPFSIGIVISRVKLLEAFPEQVFAVGGVFTTCTRQTLEWFFEYSEDGKYVYGIPIQRPNGPCLADEVRVSPKDPLITAIPRDIWEGIVIPSQEYLPIFRERLGNSPLRVPVFTPGCHLITINP